MTILCNCCVCCISFSHELIEHITDKCVNSRRDLEYQHQLELEQKTTDELKVSTVDTGIWKKTMEAMVLLFEIVRSVWSLLAYMDRQHIRWFISPGCNTYLILKEMTTKSPIDDVVSNLKQSQDWLVTNYVNSQCHKFKVDKCLVYHIFWTFSLTWMNMYTWNREGVCRTVNLFSSMSICNFSVMTSCQAVHRSRKKDWKAHTLMERKMDEIETSMLHSTRKSTQQ